MSFVDGTESYNKIKNLWITITHLPSKNSIKFKGMVTRFSDNYESKWNSEEVYGRSDPLETFQNTARMISLGWTLPAASQEEAEDNLENCAALARFMYPAYEEKTNALVAPPLLSIRFANLIREIKPDKALIGRVSGFNYTPNFDADGFYDTVGYQGTAELFPKTVEVELEFRVFHTHELGWSATGKWRGGKDFPYFSKNTGKDRAVATAAKDPCKEATKEALDATIAADTAAGTDSAGTTASTAAFANSRAKQVCAAQASKIKGAKK